LSAGGRKGRRLRIKEVFPVEVTALRAGTAHIDHGRVEVAIGEVEEIFDAETG